ncbi:MAG: hypothetical protein ABSA16_00205 [Thermoguttaceae bacterium]|jgi:hypothetical protein
MSDFTKDERQYQEAVKEAQKAGAAYPEVVAEYLRSDLRTVDSMARPVVVVRSDLDYEPLSSVIARMKVDPKLGVIVNGGQPDWETIDTRTYRAFRKAAPEVVGL